MAFAPRVLCALAALMLAACGGGAAEPATFQSLITAAGDAERSAVTLAADLSCTVDADCSALVFEGVCGPHAAPLSLRSASAPQAIAQAAEQNRLVELAIRAPDFIVPPCAPPAPGGLGVPVCVQRQCAFRPPAQ